MLCCLAPSCAFACWLRFGQIPIVFLHSYFDTLQQLLMALLVVLKSQIPDVGQTAEEKM